MKILLVQSNKSAITTLSSAFKETEYDTVAANSLKSAIRILESDVDIELVLLDSQLPNNSALKLLMRVKESLRLFRIPVIMTSSEFDQGFTEQAIKSGVSDIVVVPCDDQVLLEKTRKAIAKGKLTILIVDDDPMILDLLKYVIELERFKTLLAASAEEALDILSKNSVDAIISDIILPGQSGLDLLYHIKSAPNPIPVILITGKSDRVTSAQALKAGADGYIKKPFKNTDIVQTLRRLVKQT